MKSHGKWDDNFSIKNSAARARRASQAGQTSNRRRGVDPTTCERDYSRDEIEFMMAMQRYRERSGRNFPTWSEILEVLHGLGYRKPADAPGPDPLDPWCS